MFSTVNILQKVPIVYSFYIICFQADKCAEQVPIFKIVVRKGLKCSPAILSEYLATVLLAMTCPQILMIWSVWWLSTLCKYDRINDFVSLQIGHSKFSGM